MYDAVIKLKGFWDIKCHDASGNLKAHVFGENVVTSVGKEKLCQFLGSAAASATTNTFRYVAIGTGSTAEAASDTTLGTELTRVSGSVSYVSNAIYQVVATFTSQTGAIAEYGLFNSSANGTMLTRDTEAVVNVISSDTLTVTHQLTIS